MIINVSDKGKAVLVILAILFVVYCCLQKKDIQINKPLVTGIALPDSNVSVDQKSVQIKVDSQKPFEVGLDLLGGEVADKPAYGVRFLIRYKF